MRNFSKKMAVVTFSIRVFGFFLIVNSYSYNNNGGMAEGLKTECLAVENIPRLVDF